MLNLERLFQLSGIVTESYQLDEAREEFIAQQNADKIMAAYDNDKSANKPQVDPSKPKYDQALAVVQAVSSALAFPPSQTSDYIIKAMNWYTNADTTNGVLTFANMGELKDRLAKFKQPAVSAALAKKDINQYDLNEFIAAVDSVGDAKSKTTKEKDVEVYFKSNNLMVFIPKTEEASCKYGNNTKWCTTSTKSENKFEEYNRAGNLYVIWAKLPSGDKKFQIHMENGEFKNDQNQDVNKEEIKMLSALPEYKEFLTKLINQYYAK